jgi:hypothetical protein
MSYSDFVYGAIIQGYHKLFEVEYSDKMYQSLVYYVDAKSALKAHNFSFRVLDKGGAFSLFKDGAFFNETKMGVFSAPFLNAWISECIEGLTLFPVGFGMVHPKELRGQLSNYSAKYKDEIATHNVTDAQADVGAVDIFMSNEIVKTGKQGLFMLDHRSVNPISRVDFEDGGKVSFDDDSEEDDSSDSDSEAEREGATKPKKEPKQPKQKTPLPFYYVIAMEKKGKKLEALPKIWRKKIKEDGLSWEFTDGRLYVSNTKGASYGFPPAPHHIYNLPKLNLTLEYWESPLCRADMESKAERSAPSVKFSGAGTASGADDWVMVMDQFLDDPCFATFQIFRDSACIFKAYEAHKNDIGYKMGSNKAPMSGQIRKIICGEESAVTWPEFTDLLRSIARPNDIKGLMLILFKFRLYVAQTTDGKVYVTE